MSSRHDLSERIRQASETMAAEYQRIRNRSLEDPGTAGDAGEENWKELLEGWLPADYHVVTRGRVLFANGDASRQVDVLVLAPGYPRGLVTTNVFLAAGVLAAFECKNTLRLGHIPDAMQRGVEIRQLARNDASVHHHLLYGLLAHSYNVKARSPADSVHSALSRADLSRVSDPRDCLDVLCVASLGAWTLLRLARRNPPSVEISYMGPLINAAGRAHHGPHEPLPIGRFLTYLLRRLSTSDQRLAPLGDYFAASGQFGTGQGSVRSFRLDDSALELPEIIW